MTERVRTALSGGSAGRRLLCGPVDLLHRLARGLPRVDLLSPLLPLALGRAVVIGDAGDLGTRERGGAGRGRRGGSRRRRRGRGVPRAATAPHDLVQRLQLGDGLALHHTIEGGAKPLADLHEPLAERGEALRLGPRPREHVVAEARRHELIEAVRLSDDVPGVVGNRILCEPLPNMLLPLLGRERGVCGHRRSSLGVGQCRVDRRVPELFEEHRDTAVLRSAFSTLQFVTDAV